MEQPEITLERLVAEMRSNAANDVELAQRVALACIAIVERKNDPIPAIRTAFRIQ